jgi:hypothetical protein
MQTLKQVLKQSIIGCSGVLMLAALPLIVGYYLGYLHASSLFMDAMRSELLSDRISAAIYLRYGDAQAAPAEGNESALCAPDPDKSKCKDGESGPEAALDEETIPLLAAPAPQRTFDDGETLGDVPCLDRAPPAATQLYEAHLIGFGSLAKAERYVAHLASLGVSAQVRTRIHRTRKKKKLTWYQVISDPAPYHDLIALVDMLKKRDKLAGVVLVEHEDMPS